MSEKLNAVKHIAVTLNKGNRDVAGQMSFTRADIEMQKYFDLGYVLSSSHVVRDLGDAILFMHILALPSAVASEEKAKRGRRPATDTNENAE
jgi:hypothetical protein